MHRPRHAARGRLDAATVSCSDRDTRLAHTPPPDTSLARHRRLPAVRRLVFGLFTLTWVYSGLLSMGPFNWFSTPGLSPTQREAATGGPLQVEALTTEERCLYHGLHSLDLPALYFRRPLWDAGLMALSLGGLAAAVTSLLPAGRRLARYARLLLPP